ncbi:MAG: N-acetylneuraminate synthase family protein [Deltaproteobacteria bacterium]|nr:N-acetylneuraminate synthase family protein [Deltaproteobacteria bacterium]
MNLKGGKSVFVVAEAANSHEGSLDTAKKLVEAAVEAKADAVKFQKFVTEELLVSSHPQFSLFKSLELKEEEWKELFVYARKLKIVVFADVFDLPSAVFMASLNVPAYKIHSTDLSNPDLLQYVASQKKPVFLGVGATHLKEIEKALSFLHDDVVLMHGFQAFPTRIEDTHLAFLKTLQEKFHLPVGFMDHIDADDPFAQVLPVAAVAYGASVIEKHMTLDRSKKGIDHESALNPDEFRQFVRHVRRLEPAMGLTEREFSEAEQQYRLKMKKSIVARRDIAAGEVLTKEMLAYKRATGGLSPMDACQLLGKKITQPMRRDEVFCT